jgi:tetratricopeptide (TPR) repeat protein
LTVPAEGETLQNGRYRLEKRLGEGGKGIVYRARDTTLDRLVAVKLIKMGVSDEETYQRFLREAQIAGRLTHPNIVSIYDMGRDGEQYFLVMELVEGSSLRALVRPGSTTPVRFETALRLVTETARALRYAHSKGILHRDIKPENVMLTGEGTAKLMDFGLARALDQPRLTAVLTIVGTPAYIAPEVALGREADERSDLYSLGAVLYELVTGHPPFEGTETLKLVYSHIHDPVVPPRQRRPDTPEPVVAILERLLAKNPDERFQSAGDLLRALEEASRSLGGTAAPSPEPVPAAAAGVHGRGSTGWSSPELRRTVPLVDRTEEMASLRGWVDRALTTGGTLLTLTGEAGIGKSRLVEETRGYASARGMFCLGDRGVQWERSVPFAPWKRIFRELSERVPTQLLYKAVGANNALVAQLAPELSDRLGPAPALTVPTSTEEGRLQLLEGITQFLGNLARDQPLCLIFEELSVLDESSLDLIQTLARKVADQRILLLTTCRDIQAEEPPFFRRTIAELHRERFLIPIPLRRLDPIHVGRLIAGTLGDPTVSDEFRDLIFDKTGGNPFFVEELLRSLAEEGEIFRSEHGWGRRSIREIRLPSTVRAVLQQRLGRLDEETLNLLRIASTAGNEFSFELLQKVTDLPEDQLLDRLETALKARLLREREISANRSVYAFSDRQIRDVLYGDISMVRGRRYHARVAEALEALAGPRPDEMAADLAYHYLKANNLPKALEHSLRAAEAAERVYALGDATRHYNTALDLLEAEPNDAQRAQVLERLGDLHRIVGHLQESRQRLREALAIRERLGQRKETAHVLLEIARLEREGFYDASAAEAALVRAQGILKTLPDSVESAAALLQLGVSLVLGSEPGGQPEKVMEPLNGAIRIARSLGNHELTIEGLAWRSLYGPLAPPESIRADLEECVRGLADPHTRWVAREPIVAQTLYLAYGKGDLPAAIEFGRTATETARQKGMTSLWEDFKGQLLAFLYVESGDLRTARRLAEEGRAFGEKTYGKPDSFCLTVLGFTLALGGNVEEGLRWIRLAREGLAGLRPRVSLEDLWETETTLLRGDLERARARFDVEMARWRAYDPVTSLWGFQGAVMYCHVLRNQLRLALMLGPTGAEREMVGGLGRVATHTMSPVFQAHWRYGEGILASLSGEVEGAVGPLERARALYESSGFGYYVPFVLADLSAVYQRAGRRAEAADPLNRAIELSTRMDFTLLVQNLLARKSLVGA